MFVHGGWWRSLDPSSFSQMARGLNARGVIVAVAGYDLCPIVSIGDIIAQIRRACVFLWQRYNRPLLLVGHSAGGHLTGAMVATDWPSLYPKAPADLVPAGYAISGVFDLAPLIGVSVNQDLGSTRLQRANYRRSILAGARPGASSMPSAAGSKSNEFKRQSRVLARSLGKGRRQNALRGESPAPTISP